MLSPIPQPDLSQLDVPAKWSSILCPSIEKALTSTQAYTEEEVRNYLAFFSTEVISWLGPAPSPTGTPSPNGKLDIRWKAAYPSALTSDHSPVEISYSWKCADVKGNIAPVARFVTDTIPSDAQLSRFESLARASHAINHIRSLETSSYKLLGFPDLWTCVTDQLTKNDREIHTTGTSPCVQCSTSSTFIGFDLASTHIKAKLYWLLPSCLTVPALLKLLDDLFTVCLAERYFTRLRNFTSQWTQIRDHIHSHLDTLQPRMLCLDATKHPFPRLKLYSRCYFHDEESFDAIQSHLKLGGAIELHDRFLNTCRDLWSCLMENFRKYPEPNSQSQGPRQGSRYCMIVHEISAASSTAEDVVDSCLASKWYLFCDRMPGRDAFVTRDLLSRFEGPAHFFPM
ncbi:MAG: hypothetical protein Q9195_004609 [Heterodermia aff. obscurata]